MRFLQLIRITKQLPLTREILKAVRSRMPLPAHPYPEQFSESLDFLPCESATAFYLLASTPRCGSHYLGHMLKESGELGVPLEYLNPSNAKYWRRRFGALPLPDLFPYFVRYRTSPNGNFCMKAHWSDFAPHKDKMHVLTKGKGLKKIVWTARKDQLSQAISLAIARQTGEWITGAPQREVPKYGYDLIVRAAEDIQSQNLEWLKYLEEYFAPQTSLVLYEDLITSETSRANLASFLEISSPLLPAERTKVQRSFINDEWRGKFLSESRNEDAWIADTPTWLAAGTARFTRINSLL